MRMPRCVDLGADVVGPPEGLISALGFAVERSSFFSAQLPLPLPHQLPENLCSAMSCCLVLSLWQDGPQLPTEWGSDLISFLGFPAPPASGFPGKHLGFSGVINCPLGTTLFERNSHTLAVPFSLITASSDQRKCDKADWLFISWILSFALGAGKARRSCGQGQQAVGRASCIQLYKESSGL